MIVVLIVVFFALLALAVPVGHVLVIASGSAVASSGTLPLMIVAQQMYNQTQSFPMLALLLSWSRRRQWLSSHYLAIAAGTVLTYAWVGLSRFLSGTTNLGMATTRIDKIGQVVEVLVILALIAVGLEAAASSPGGDS